MNYCSSSKLGVTDDGLCSVGYCQYTTSGLLSYYLRATRGVSRSLDLCDLCVCPTVCVLDFQTEQLGKTVKRLDYVCFGVHIFYSGATTENVVNNLQK